LVLLTSISAKHHTTSPKSFPLHFYPSFYKATPLTPSRKNETKGFYFLWLIILKIFRNKLRYSWEKIAHNETESRSFLQRNKPQILLTHRTEFPNIQSSQSF